MKPKPPKASTLTLPLIHAAGWDAGNKSMAKAGRKVWSVKDWNVAAREYLRLARIAGLAPALRSLRELAQGADGAHRRQPK